MRVRAIGLNFADCAARLGVYPRVPKPPFVPGMEVSGEVVALGEGAAGPPSGTRVAAVPIFGGHAELVQRAAPASCGRCRRGWTSSTGASLAVTGLTADHALFTVGTGARRGAGRDHRGGRRGRHDRRADGGGAGARVLAVASTPAKRELARTLGAHEATGYEGYREALAGGVDVVRGRGGRRALPHGLEGAQARRALRALRLRRRRSGRGACATCRPRSSSCAWARCSLDARPAQPHARRLQPLAGAAPGRRSSSRASPASRGCWPRGALKAVVGAVFPFEQLPQGARAAAGARLHRQGRGHGSESVARSCRAVGLAVPLRGGCISLPRVGRPLIPAFHTAWRLLPACPTGGPDRVARSLWAGRRRGSAAAPTPPRATAHSAQPACASRGPSLCPSQHATLGRASAPRPVCAARCPRSPEPWPPSAAALI